MQSRTEAEDEFDRVNVEVPQELSFSCRLELAVARTTKMRRVKRLRIDRTVIVVLKGWIACTSSPMVWI